MELLIVLGIIALVVFFIVAIYNSLVALRNRFKNAYAQIDVQLQRRYDLIPNLVEVAKKYLSHEQDTLTAVINARNQAHAASKQAAAHPDDAGAIKNLVGAEAALTGTLGRLFALSEAYPDLKANQTMAQLSEELTSTENRVAYARQAFNDAVMTYNTKRETFPSNIVAGVFNFKEAELFTVDNPEARSAPKVAFS
jgi:LemA protein